MPDTWLLQSVRYFRAFGFFADQSAMSDEELAAYLEDREQYRFGMFDPNDELADLLLLSWDDQRVWWDDTEAEVHGEEKVYEEALRAWSAISRGAFMPENIRETWASETGPVEITFDHKGRAQFVYPAYLDDYIDVGILSAINQIIADSGIQFAVYAIFDQTAFVVALTQVEKEKLRNERGWRFAL